MSESPGGPVEREPGGPAGGASRRSPRRNLTGIGFILLGVWFASTSLQLDAPLALRVPLVLLGAAVCVYGALQLQRPRG